MHEHLFYHHPHYQIRILRTGMMDRNRILTGIDKLLSILHIAILFLSALMFTFVFIINWEDWFFGTKLAGPLAGLFLAAKAAGAIILLFLITQYPNRWKAVLPASIAYFGFLFFNAAVTYRSTAEPGSFPTILAILVVIPVLLLIVDLVTAKPDTRRDADQQDTSEKGVAIPPGDSKRMSIHPRLLLLGAIILLMLCYIFVIPLGIAIVITHVPFLHQLVLPPAHDTVLVKTDTLGNREWSTIIPGYSLDFVQLVDGDNESCILFGTYWMPQQGEAQIRVLKIDRDGNRVWDMTRSRQFGSGQQGIAQIAWVDPSGSGAVVWLTNGGSLQLDENGAVIGETPEADTLPQRTTEFQMPPRYTVTELPAPAVTLRIFPDGGQEIMLVFEDTLTHKEIQSVYAVNPTADGGYLVSASVNP
jgi:hypothetical protein